MKEKIRRIISQAVEELNEQRDDDRQLLCTPETRLIGRNAEIDSMEFVTLISIVEDIMNDELGKAVRIVSDRAFSKEHSPFYSVETLTDFIVELIEDKS